MTKINCCGENKLSCGENKLWFVHVRCLKINLSDNYSAPRAAFGWNISWESSITLRGLLRSSVRLNKTSQRREKVRITFRLNYFRWRMPWNRKTAVSLDDKAAKISRQVNDGRKNIYFGRCTLSIKSIVELNQRYKSFRFVSQETVFLFILFIR